MMAFQKIFKTLFVASVCCFVFAAVLKAPQPVDEQWLSDSQKEWLKPLSGEAQRFFGLLNSHGQNTLLKKFDDGTIDFCLPQEAFNDFVKLVEQFDEIKSCLDAMWQPFEGETLYRRLVVDAIQPTCYGSYEIAWRKILRQERESVVPVEEVRQQDLLDAVCFHLLWNLALNQKQLDKFCIVLHSINELLSNVLSQPAANVVRSKDECLRCQWCTLIIRELCGQLVTMHPARDSEPLSMAMPRCVSPCDSERASTTSPDLSCSASLGLSADGLSSKASVSPVIASPQRCSPPPFGSMQQPSSPVYQARRKHASSKFSRDKFGSAEPSRSPSLYQLCPTLADRISYGERVHGTCNRLGCPWGHFVLPDEHGVQDEKTVQIVCTKPECRSNSSIWCLCAHPWRGK